MKVNGDLFKNVSEGFETDNPSLAVKILNYTFRSILPSPRERETEKVRKKKRRERLP